MKKVGAKMIEAKAKHVKLTLGSITVDTERIYV